jgi:hypothetical protein
MRFVFFKTPLLVSLLLLAVVVSLALAGPALAETHSFITSFGSFTNPNGIAVDEATGDVYVADLGTDTVYKFDASGNPVNFTAGGGIGTNALTGAETPAGSFEFPNEPGTPAAIAVDNSTSPSDPSRGDLYVLDAGHEVIDKFNANGEALPPITGPFSFPPLGVGVDASGNIRVDVRGPYRGDLAVEVFDAAAANGPGVLVSQIQADSESGGTQVYGFATGGEPGADYPLLSPCGCVAKLGPHGELYGRVDGGSSAVAAAVDPASGHVYVDDQSSVGEWDTGEMNGRPPLARNEPEKDVKSTGTFVSSFGSFQLSGSSGQGGIAVNGASGNVYVSNPADGKVYVFGGSAPVAVAGTAADVTQTSATLRGTVDPRGVPVQSCRFEYATSPSNDLTVPIALLGHSVECVGAHGESVVGATSPVALHADISGVVPGSLYHFRLVVSNANGASHSGGLFATASVGFGFKQFEVSFLNQDGTPDVQAGSHPYKMVTNIVFNTQVVPKSADNLRYVALPAGNAKDVAVHLPPGFYGDPDATVKKCTLQELVPGGLGDICPPESEVGTLESEHNEGPGLPRPTVDGKRLVSVVPPPGVAFQMAAKILVPDAFINVGVPAGGDSGVVAVSEGIPGTVPVFRATTTIFGVPPVGATKPLLTLPTSCNGPLTSTISGDSYQDAGHFASASSVAPGMSNCAPLVFPPAITVAPDVPAASSSSGLTVGVHVSQKAALNPGGLAESALRDTTVVLPAGVAINPAGGDGLQSCSEGLAGFTGFTEFNPQFEPGDKTATFTPELPSPLVPGTNFCPDASKIGSVKLKTPLLPNPLEGSVYLAAQNSNPFGSLLAMYMIIEDPVSGTIVKLTGRVSLCETVGEVLDGVSCEASGQIVTTFKNTPQLPFEDLELHFFGGERAPLATPARCGTYTTKAVFTPWSGTAPVSTTSSFQITQGPHGSACPGASLPFSPSLAGGASNINAGSFTPLTTTIGREDGEQNLQSVTLHMPAGLSGLLSGVKLCGEAQANDGTCGPDSLIGETTVSAGVGSDPVSVKGGRVYITEKYEGAPFGLSIVNPVKAGPFDLERDTSNPAQNPACDCVVVRAKIEVDPHTAALTITTDPSGPHAIPRLIDGIPVQIQKVNVLVNRPGFTFNPTNCNSMSLTGAIAGDEGASAPVSVPFQATNCATLAFAPKFAVSTSGRTSKANGASLSVRLTYPKAPFGSQANIAKVKVELPKQLPSRLTTLQKACTAAQFSTNPAGCPAASVIGHAKAITPLIPVPLEGPAYFVSHGGEAFPSLIIVLQGYGVTIDLVGTTFISKAGITSSTFKTVPDAPVGSFELTLPQGRFSALAANGNLCTSRLVMPTEFVAQNGAVIHRSTRVGVTGCAKKKALTRTQKLAAALKACHKKAKGHHKRVVCERVARKKYGPLKRKKKR